MNDHYRPSRTRGLGDNDTGGLTPDIQQEIRSAAAEACRNWRDGAPVAMPEPELDLLVRMLSFSLGLQTFAKHQRERRWTAGAAVGSRVPP